MTIAPSTHHRVMEERNIKAHALAWCSLALWITSLFVPAVRDGGREILYGYDILEFGWLGVLMLQFGWLSNIFFIYVVAKTLFGCRVSAFLSGLLGVSLLSSIYWGYFGHVTYDAGDSLITGRFIGFYIWVLSISIAVAIPPISSTVIRSAMRL